MSDEAQVFRSLLDKYERPCRVVVEQDDDGDDMDTFEDEFDISCYTTTQQLADLIVDKIDAWDKRFVPLPDSYIEQDDIQMTINGTTLDSIELRLYELKQDTILVKVEWTESMMEKQRQEKKRRIS
jgi:hypothetical protein